MVIIVAHLAIAAIWLGSMVYSLAVVQPAVARAFGDEARREAFLLALAHGNRWRVASMVAVLMLSAIAVMLTDPRIAPGYGIAFVLYGVAAGIFVNVSWRHWPARVFALPDELAGFRRRLRFQAWAILGLVAIAFTVALSVSVRAGH